MKILLINPPDCGRSIPEERYGITSMKQIFRGEPLALEELAGNLLDHDVSIVDMKADTEGLKEEMACGASDLVGITGVTCEANTMLRIAATVKRNGNPVVVVGGIHASNDPHFFNRESIDFVVMGLGKRSFAELAAFLAQGGKPESVKIPGVIKTTPGKKLSGPRHMATESDLVAARAPAYHLVQKYRSHYILEKLGITMGFVASAFGCTHCCTFCCIKGQTGGRYLMKPVDTVIRDIGLHEGIPVIRLVDANTFADVARASRLGAALIKSGIKKQYIADIRADTVVRHPELLALWKEAGLRAVIIGFEDINNENLLAMNKVSDVQLNTEAISILGEMGITIVGDFIISPDYTETDFQRLGNYLSSHDVDLPMITVLTPLPGTPLYKRVRKKITNHNLDYYTLTNAVTRTRLQEKQFYTFYAELIAKSHLNARL